MSAARLTIRSMRASATFTRSISTTRRLFAGPGNAKSHEGTEEYRKAQTEKPLNPHITNTTSTITNDMPSVGKDKAPPELISSVDGKFVPKDSDPENTNTKTGGTQKSAFSGKLNPELGVGELEGAQFKVEPLRRIGEDANTMRARLLYQSRKRGTLESDLLMSTFADTHLPNMTKEQMAQYDLFLDENDWDIYYWATQEPSPTSRETAEGAGPGPEGATANSRGTDVGKQTSSALETDEWRQGSPRSGEWAQTVGTFKPAHRPVPARWRNSEILSMLRRHVIERSAGGIAGAPMDINQTTGGKGMAFMPEIKNMDA